MQRGMGPKLSSETGVPLKRARTTLMDIVQGKMECAGALALSAHGEFLYFCDNTI